MKNYELWLENNLKQLSPKKCTVYGLWCCKRLLHNYYTFTKLEKWGDINVMLDSLNIIEKNYARWTFDDNLIESVLRNIEAITPDTEKFSSIYVSFALDACNAFYETLSYVISCDTQRIIDVGIFVRDTVDMFIQEKENLDYNDPLLEDKISKNFFMVSEMEKQKSFFKELKKADDTTIGNLLNEVTKDHVIDLKLL